MAYKHVRDNHNPLRDRAIAHTAKNVMEDYDLPHIPPPPKQVTAPFRFLGIFKHKRLGWCTRNGQTSHYKKFHRKVKSYKRATPKQVDTLQSWYQPFTYRQYFEVSESLAVVPSTSSTNTIDKRRAAAEAYFNVEEPDKEQRVMRAPSDKDTSLHIAEQGWATLLDGKDPEAIVDMVELPDDPADPLYKLREICGNMFADIDKMISTLDPKFLELAVDAGPKGRRSHPFGQVGICAKRRYTRLMIRFVAALLRTSARLAEDMDTHDPMIFTPFITEQQKTLSLKLWDLLHQKRVPMIRLKESVQALLASCYAPGEGLPSDCEYMCNDKFRDFVHTFCAMFSVNKNRTFKGAEQIVPVTTALQYIIRAAVLVEVQVQANRLGGTVASFEKYSYFLDRDQLTPFGCLKTLRKRMIYYEAAARKTGKLHWTGENSETCHFHGTEIPMKALKKLAKFLITDLDDRLKKVLRGVSLEDLDADLPTRLDLYDLITNDSAGYSFVNDDRNKRLTKLARKLEYEFITRRNLDEQFWDGETSDTKGCPVWNDGARKRWLQEVGELSHRLALAMHVWGGQPARGSEFHFLRYRNPDLSGSRRRNLFYLDKRLIYIIWYSKTSRVTGVDRAAIHALSPELSRLAMIITAVVFPLATRWTGELLGEDARDNQKTYMFCKVGQVMSPRRLSLMLSEVSFKFFGVKLGIRAFRHLIIAIQREHLVLPSRTNLTNIFNLQAHHSHRVSNERYAVPSDDATFTGNHTFKAYIEASAVLHEWLNEIEDCSPLKRKHIRVEPGRGNASQNEGKRRRTGIASGSLSFDCNEGKSGNITDNEWESEEELSDNDVDEDVEDQYSEAESELE
ncbi:DNA helicase [Ceratobasidium sp. AG-Ba]|nr:DNA helicase [Ceratobasidium sp. AG-Ba]